MEWNDLRKKIENHKLDSATWKSDKEGLLKIISFAEMNNISPMSVVNSKLSNLRAIISLGKKCVKRKDAKELELLFKDAASLTNRDLKLKIGTTVPEIIYVTKGGGKGKSTYTITFTGEQFAKLQNSMKQYYKFQIESSLKTQ